MFFVQRNAGALGLRADAPEVDRYLPLGLSRCVQVSAGPPCLGACVVSPQPQGAG